MYRKTDEYPLRVELVTDKNDLEYYGDILTRRHYLGTSQINRNTILHVVKRGRDVVAIVTWEGRQQSWFSLRDRVIGWTEGQRDQRLKYVVENRRFLMLVEEKNLASSVLAHSLARLGEDGEKKLGHGFLLAETFVDPSHGFDGTCYKAAGWHEVGLTCGGRGRDTRSKKLYFVKELKQDALAKLKHPEFSASDLANPRQKILSLERLNLKSLRKCLESVPEHRKRPSRLNPLPGLLALLLTGVLCGNTRLSDIHRWIESLSQEVIRSLGFRKHPSYKILWTALNRVDSQMLSQALCGWLSEQADALATITPTLKVLSLDGKTLRGGSKAGDTIHIMTLIDTVTKIIKAQVLVPSGKDKTNEIPVAQKLLATQPLDANTIVIADAMHTQTKTAEVILKKTPITYSRLKTTKEISEKLSKTKLPASNGRYQRLLSTLSTVE
jgi:hypothetical protein